MRIDKNNKRNYFLLNKKADFQRGYAYGIRTGENGIAPKTHGGEGVYYTRIFDSGERLTEWHRLIVSGEFPAGSFCGITVYASDGKNLPGGLRTVEEVVSGGGLQDEKDALLQPCCAAVFENVCDMPLFSVRGRYLWLKITLRAQGEALPEIARIKICFPKHTWLSYLPEIYSEDLKSASFLERYLGIFQSFYEDMTDRIADTPRLLEPSAADRELLWGMADWFSVENRDLWNEEQLRYLVRHAVRLRGLRGTVAGVKELIRLYTGEEAYVVEYHRIRPFFDGDKTERLLKRLYTGNRFVFAVLLCRRGTEQAWRLSLLKQVVAMEKPAHMTVRIILLQPYIFLDKHSYLGINSTLGQYRQFRLDGSCALDFSVIAERKGGTPS